LEWYSNLHVDSISVHKVTQYHCQQGFVKRNQSAASFPRLHRSALSSMLIVYSLQHMYCTRTYFILEKAVISSLLTLLHFSTGDLIMLNTGCSVTLCSALSQASCQSPDDRRGAAWLPEDVGGHVGLTICKKRRNG
jgi:hypothetical protein